MQPVTTVSVTSESASESEQNDNDRSAALNVYFDLLDNVTGEFEKRFGVLQSDVARAIDATNPTSDTFMDKTQLQPLADLADVTLDDMELELAKRFVLKNKTDFPDITAIVKSPVIQSMTSVLAVLHLAMTIAVSTAVNESSFSCLKRILTPHRMSMLHQRKADLILVSFERQLAKRVRSDGQALLRRFSDCGRRRLQLF